MFRLQRRRQGRAVEAADHAARDALVRARLRQRALALRLSRRQAAGRHGERGAEDAVPLRAARRLLAGLLPRAVVPRRRVHREPGARAQPRDPEARPTTRVYSDRGGAMKAAETTEGLERLGIAQYLTLPNSPHQNGKQEHFWTQIEGRLMPMLDGEPVLTLELSNTATQAWVEQEYHRATARRAQQEDAARTLPRGPEREPSEPRLGGAASSLPHGAHAQAAPDRRHRHGGWHSLRGPLGVPHARASPAPRRALGSTRASSSSTRARARTSRRSTRSTR